MIETTNKEAISREKILQQLFSAPKDSYILAGILDNVSHPSMLVRGAVGILDWELHGQVSKLILRGERTPFLIPHPNLPLQILFVFYKSKQDAKKISETVKKLQQSKITFLESTFEKDILEELKQNFKKGQIDFKSMEQ